MRREGSTRVIRLRASRVDELERFDRLDRQEHARRFVLATGLARHRELFRDDAVTYLSIETMDGTFCGYFILVHEQEVETVEFRRIIIDASARGVGQTAIGLMEDFCRTRLKAKRIWLDVFDDNTRGMHIYEKLGYRRFREEAVEDRKLLFYEKPL